MVGGFNFLLQVKQVWFEWLDFFVALVKDGVKLYFAQIYASDCVSCFLGTELVTIGDLAGVGVFVGVSEDNENVFLHELIIQEGCAAGAPFLLIKENQRYIVVAIKRRLN